MKALFVPLPCCGLRLHMRNLGTWRVKWSVVDNCFIGAAGLLKCWGQRPKMEMRKLSLITLLVILMSVSSSECLGEEGARCTFANLRSKNLKQCNKTIGLGCDLFKRKCKCRNLEIMGSTCDIKYISWFKVQRNCWTQCVGIPKQPCGVLQGRCILHAYCNKDKGICECNLGFEISDDGRGCDPRKSGAGKHRANSSSRSVIRNETQILNRSPQLSFIWQLSKLSLLTWVVHMCSIYCSL